jgi:hypothetical protein
MAFGARRKPFAPALHQKQRPGADAPGRAVKINER